MRSRLIPFSILALVLLLVALYTGESIFYMLFSACILTLVVSALSLLFTALLYNYIQSYDPQKAIKGEVVELQMNMHNDTILPFALIEVEYDIPQSYLEGVVHLSSFSLMPGQNFSIREKIPCRYRGTWPIGLKKAYIYDLFGLFRIPVNFHKIARYKTLSLKIYPRIILLTALPLPKWEVDDESIAEPQSTQDIAQISDIRKYVPGDPLKKVHWKLSMRQREYMVKNYEQNTLPATLLYLDSSDHALEGLDAVELEDMMVECATSVSYYVLSHWMPLSMITYGHERIVLKGSRPDDFGAFHEYLAALPFESLFTMSDILANELTGIGKVGCIFMIAHSMDSAAFDQLITLREAGIEITLMLVYSPAMAQSAQRSLIYSKLVDVGITVIDLAPSDDLAAKLGVIS